jgi:hypothetical protein
LGPLPIRLARHRAELLASVCRATAETVLGRQEYGMESGNLVGRVVKACQAAIGKALSNPGEALAIAGGLQSAIATLNLVANETATPLRPCAERGCGATAAEHQVTGHDAAGAIGRELEQSAMGPGGAQEARARAGSGHGFEAYVRPT